MIPPAVLRRVDALAAKKGVGREEMAVILLQQGCDRLERGR